MKEDIVLQSFILRFFICFKFLKPRDILRVLFQFYEYYFLKKHCDKFLITM